MGARQHPDTAKAIARIIKGLPVKDAAVLYKLHPTTLWKAMRKLKDVGKIPTNEVVETHPLNHLTTGE